LRGVCGRLRWVILAVLLTIVLLPSGVVLPQAHAQLRRATRLTLSPETFTIASGQSITLTAKLTSDGQPLPGKQIIFTATLGSISPNIAVTDENGFASTVYTAPKLSVRASVTVTASFLGDLTHEGSTATCQGVIEIELLKLSISGASFTVPETIRDDVSSYRRAIPEDLLKLLPIALPSESFILATPEDLYLVFADRSDRGLAHVEGWKLPHDVNLRGISMGVIVAESVEFEKEGVPATIGEILANPENYRFKLVRISADRRQASILYDPDEPPYIEFPITVGYLVEKPLKPLDILGRMLGKAKDFALKLDEQLIRSLLETGEKERLWLFNFEYEYWYDAPTVTNGIIIPTDHPVFKLISQSMPVVGRFACLDGKVVLYDVKTDIPYEEVSSVSELKTNYDKYLGRVVKVTANCYGGYISVQEIIEHNTPCGEDYAYIEDVGCVNIVVDARLEGLVAWSDVSIPPKCEELLLVAGVSSFHQDEQFVNVTGAFELVGKVVSAKQISESLPEGVALTICWAKKVGEVDFEKIAQQIKDRIRDDAGRLYWVLQDIYPYRKQPSIPYRVPEKVFSPKAPIFVETPRDIPEICVEESFTINVAVATPEDPIKLNITNSYISSISITLREIARNITIFFEKLTGKPREIPEPPSPVYAYHEISVNISKEVLKEANITFWVSKEWLVANKATAESVIMLRYHAGEWAELPTRFVSENVTHFKFTAETPGFSVFAIAVREVKEGIKISVEGYVRDEIGKPISSVRVIALSRIVALGKISETKTDEMGHYLMELPPGEYILVFSVAGYADRSVDVSLKLGELKRVDVSLKQAKVEFSEDWGGARFEAALITREPWKVGGEVSVEVWITVSDMGGNQQVEFRQLKLRLFGTGVEKTIPLNVKTDAGGTVYSGNVTLRILDGLSSMRPDSSDSYSLWLNLEGSVTGRWDIVWPGLTMESTSVRVYAPPSPVSVSAELPAKVTVGEEFDVKAKVRNEGEYPVNNVKVELLPIFGASAAGPLDWSRSILNPGEEAVATFRLKATTAATPSVTTILSYTTLWGYAVYDSKVLGSLTIEEKKACIIATAAYGSELDPHVQLLRSFRDNVVLKTFAGSKFMDVFNAWYYSFSPSIASLISGNDHLRAVVRGMLYPLIGILRLGILINDAFSFNSEVGVIITGIAISMLIGLAYFTPPTLLILYVIGRRRGAPKLRLKMLLAPWTTSILLVTLAELMSSPTLMMIGSGALVLSTIALIVWTTVLKATARLLASHNPKQ
jgi:PGF-pre-PGF domain-containing protein